MTELSLGVFQGRLSEEIDGRIQAFPGQVWPHEFELAAELGYGNIEWIYETFNHQHNALATPSGQKEILKSIAATGVTVESVCADYFMDMPYFQADKKKKNELKRKLSWLVEQTANIEAKFIDLPFVDVSKIACEDQFSEVVDFVGSVLDSAAEQGITICLETNLNPSLSRKLVDLFDSEHVGINYDSGNSASLGYDVNEEFFAYGDRIKSIHIKDRVYGGGTVPLGEGDCDVDQFFMLVEKYDFSGPVVLQASREGAGVRELGLKNLEFVKRGMESARV